MKSAVALVKVKGVVAERVVLSTPADPFLDLQAISEYCSLSVRKLRDLLADPVVPIPSYRVGGKLLVRRSEFDGWMAWHRNKPAIDVDAVVRDLLGRG